MSTIVNQPVLLLLVTCYTCLSLMSGVSQVFASDAHRLEKVLSMYQDYRRDFAEVPDMPAGKAIELHGQKDVLFIDVRSEEEQKVSIIPGAISENDFLAKLDTYRDKQLIVYCTISYRSGKFARKIARKGIVATNLEGGLLGWVHAGGSLSAHGESTSRLHVYGRKWDLAPASIETTY